MAFKQLFVSFFCRWLNIDLAHLEPDSNSENVDIDFDVDVVIDATKSNVATMFYEPSLPSVSLLPLFDSLRPVITPVLTTPVAFSLSVDGSDVRRLADAYQRREREPRQAEVDQPLWHQRANFAAADAKLRRPL